MTEVVTAGILVIGDEILSGRTKDKNIGFIAEYLTNIGIDLKEVDGFSSYTVDKVPEYEVARLHTDPAFTAKIAGMFEGDVKLTHHLAPPLLAKTNGKGELIKKPYGAWVRTAFGLLAKLKGLRGSALDPFARTEERKTERALIGEYRACIEELLRTLSAANLTQAAEIARIPEEIRGFGHVKARHLAAARGKWSTLMAQWRTGSAGAQRAA